MLEKLREMAKRRIGIVGYGFIGKHDEVCCVSCLHIAGDTPKILDLLHTHAIMTSELLQAAFIKGLQHKCCKIPDPTEVVI